jgi:hypothetical protein
MLAQKCYPVSEITNVKYHDDIGFFFGKDFFQECRVANVSIVYFHAVRYTFGVTVGEVVEDDDCVFRWIGEEFEYCV